MIETIALVLTGLSITASIVYYTSILRNANMTRELQLKAQEQATLTRQTQIFMNLYDKFMSKETSRSYMELRSWQWNDFNDYQMKYGWENNPEAFVLRSSMGTYFEGIGVLVKNDQIPVNLVDDLLSNGIMFYWEKFEPIILEYRTRMNYPNMGEWAEYLYNQVKPIFLKQHPEQAS